jgi:hypothetical protein
MNIEEVAGYFWHIGGKESSVVERINEIIQNFVQKEIYT